MENEHQNKMWTYALIGILTTVVVLAFARLSYGVVLPFMKEGLHLTYKEAGFLGTFNSLGYLSTVMLAGVVAAKWGGKQTIVLGVLLVTSGLVGLTFTTTYWVTIFFMLLLGIGTSFTYTPFISLLVAWFPHRKGLVIGLTTSGVGIGMLFVGILVPYLSIIFPSIGWRISWGIFSIISLSLVLLTLLFIKNPPTEKLNSEQNDLQSKPSEIYKNHNVINVGLIYGVVGITYIIQMIFIMSFMVEAGLEEKVAGQLVALNGLLSIFSGPIWGFISDKLGRRTSLILTMALTLFSMILPIIFPTLLGFLFHMLILSCTMTGLFTMVQAASMDQVKSSDMPLAFSYVTFYFAIGQFIGPTIAGWLIDDFGGFKSAFLFSSICLAIGLLLTFRVNRSSSKNPVVEAAQS